MGSIIPELQNRVTRFFKYANLDFDLKNDFY